MQFVLKSLERIESQYRKLYLEKKEDIQFVKSYMMPYLEGVEEARFYVQEAMKEEERSNHPIGDELDAEQEKEINECLEEDENIHPDFVQVNPDELNSDNDLSQVKKTLVREIIVQHFSNMDVK